MENNTEEYAEKVRQQKYRITADPVTAKKWYDEQAKEHRFQRGVAPSQVSEANKIGTNARLCAEAAGLPPSAIDIAEAVAIGTLHVTEKMDRLKS